MLKNMKVKKSLLLGYVITIVISALLNATSLSMMKAQNNKYQDLIGREIEASIMVMQARNSANIAARNLRDILLIPDDPANDKMEARAHEVVKDLTDYLAKLSELYPEDMDRAPLEDYLAAVESWKNNLQDILSMYHSHDIAGAIRDIQTDCTPALNAMAEKAVKLDNMMTDSMAQKVEQIHRTVMITIIAMIVCMVVATLCVIALATKIVYSIVEPTKEVHEALVGFSRGELDIPVEYESENELGEMCDALRVSQKNLNGIIQEETYLLGEMAKGNFALKFQNEDMYVGALTAVKDSISTINQNLSDTLTQINLSAEQVSAGSEQVSTGAQALAQGATEQASAVEELSATINEISGDAQKTAKRSEEALERANYTGARVDESAQNMEEMVQAMGRISDSSQEISKIIATIENIAFQTNILALNAAVEAARAGSAGKGFAVVADEVRNLSAKSDQAAKATKELIDHSITSVQDGNAIVERVSTSLQKTVEATNELKGSIDEITKAIEHQAEAITQVTDGIEQISCVVQTNSATSEESAATSEELSSQASIMRNLMAQFTLHTTEQDFRGAAPSDSYQYDAQGDQDEPAGASAGTSFSKY